MVSSHGVTYGVDPHVAHMKVAARVREHRQHVELVTTILLALWIVNTGNMPIELYFYLRIIFVQMSRALAIANVSV